MRLWLRRLFATRAVLLAVLMVWFATHHLAPTFGHAQHHTQDQELRWQAAHPPMQHCEFCFSVGYLGVWLENALPRAPKQVARAVENIDFDVVAVLQAALARAPPMG